MQLHRDLASEGLVVMSLDVNTAEVEQKDEVLKFLKSQNADFPNYILTGDDEKAYAWLEKYEATATPALVVFNRQGERVPTPDFTGSKQEKLDAEEAFIKKLLAEK